MHYNIITHIHTHKWAHQIKLPEQLPLTLPCELRGLLHFLNMSLMNFWFHAVQSNFKVIPGVQLKRCLQTFAVHSKLQLTARLDRTSKDKINKKAVQAHTQKPSTTHRVCAVSKNGGVMGTDSKKERQTVKVALSIWCGSLVQKI